MRNFLKICGCFSALFLLVRVNDFSSGKKKSVETMQNNFSKYHENTVTIHRCLHNIYNLSSHSKMAEAENMFGDVVRLWNARDVLMKPYQTQNFTFKHFPSDSLVRLGRLLKVRNEQNSGVQTYLIAQEIKRIQGIMDECDISSKVTRAD